MKAILLAAGCSKRMGQQKQLLIWQGKTLLQHSIDKLNDAGFEVITVLGSSANRIRPLISDSQVIVNKNWQEGMGTSIAMAVKMLTADDSLVLIAQVDQLALTTDDFMLLKSNSLQHQQQIICSSFDAAIKDEFTPSTKQKIFSAPAIFPAKYFPQLINLKGNIGARKIILGAIERQQADKKSSSENRVNVYPVQISNAAININTPDDWDHWQKSVNEKTI